MTQGREFCDSLVEARHDLFAHIGKASVSLRPAGVVYIYLSLPSNKEIFTKWVWSPII